MISYILIEIEGHGDAYQEIANGQVVRYLDVDGTELYKVIPIGVGSWVIDANPTRLSWMI